MADFKYIMQGFQKDINFFDEIKEVLETEDYTSIWILTAFVNERAICNLMPSIKEIKSGYFIYYRNKKQCINISGFKMFNKYEGERICI